MIQRVMQTDNKQRNDENGKMDGDSGSSRITVRVPGKEREMGGRSTGEERDKLGWDLVQA